MKKSAFFFIIIIILITLYATNPTKNDFKEYANEYLKNEIKNAGVISNSFMETFINAISGRAVSTAVDIAVEREEYYLYSIYSIEGLELDYKFLGIFRRFIPIKNFIDVSKINIQYKDPRAIIDDKVTIEEDHYRTYKINLKGLTEIRISGELVSGPPIDILFLDNEGLSLWEKLMKGNIDTKVPYIKILSQLGGTSFDKSEKLNKGTYYIVLDNTDMGGTMPPMNFENDVSSLEIKVITKELY